MPNGGKIPFKYLPNSPMTVDTVPGERHPHPPTTGELLALLVHHRLRESQAAEQLRGLLLGELGP